MKKVWIILGILAGIVVLYFALAYLGLISYYKCDSVGCGWVCLESGFRSCRLGFGPRYEIIKYGQGSFKAQYRQSEGDGFHNLTAAQVEEKFYSPISFSGDKYLGREVWIGSGPKYEGQTVIFLKHKNADLFDSYSLQGGP